ncbi:MAG: glycerol-3-phosphate acyltransferase PlsY [Chloroflexi bacterium]|nr:MAG: glycerol-3-phosphate acyltransferase PlsY [Chloroflexota bacterium]
MLEAWIAGLVVGYLIGSVPNGLWVGRLVAKTDLRAEGSGKIGTTNAYRKLGLRWALIIFSLDVGKGVLPVAILMLAFDSPTGEVLAALATLIGHIYPLFAGFRGGRAAATGWGAILILTPFAALVAIAVAAALLGITRIMSLTVLLGMTVSAVAQGLLIAYGGEPDAYYGFVVASWLIVLLAHRDNIVRLAAGTERVLGRPAADATPAAAHNDDPAAS